MTNSTPTEYLARYTRTNDYHTLEATTLDAALREAAALSKRELYTEDGRPGQIELHARRAGDYSLHGLREVARYDGGIRLS